jgi:hypothetical protein
MDNTQGIVLIIGMLFVFIGIPTICICTRTNYYENDKNNTYTQLNSTTPSKYVEA